MRTLFVIALLFIAGCIPATQQEVLQLTTVVEQILPAVREAVSTSSEETRDKVEIVLGQVEEINEAVATAETPVEAVKVAVAASSPFNPYAVPILAGITILEALGIIGVNKLRKNNHTALEEVVIGVEDSKKNGGSLKVAFNATESLATRRKVAKIINGT
jgi:hypothetical protein